MINLEKHEERKRQVKVTLEKMQIPDQKAQVLFFIDNSGSMRGMYHTGEVQETFERILPLANVLDDDGKMPVFAFNQRVSSCGEAAVSNAGDFINRHIVAGGGTEYAPIIKQALKEKNSKMPTLAIVITDGDNWDQQETTDSIIKASKENIFFQFIGIGGDTFSYLDQIDNMEGRYVDNVGFFKVDNLSQLSDQQLYSLLIKEFPHWLQAYDKKKSEKKGLFGFLK